MRKAIFIVLLLALATVIGINYIGDRVKEEVPVFNDNSKVHQKGDKNGQILHAYMSPTCEACSGISLAIDLILREYEELGYQYHHVLTSDLDARIAENMECAADQKKFWQMHDEVFDRLDTITSSRHLIEVSRDIGINQKAFKFCLTSGKHRKDLPQISSPEDPLPHFKLGDLEVTGIETLDELREFISQQLVPKT